MGDTTEWLAGRVASLVPNMLPAATAAASSSSGGSGGSGSCGPLQSIYSSCFNHVCATNPAMLQSSYVFVSVCGKTATMPKACCPAVA
jgi:hypothetical protein